MPSIRPFVSLLAILGLFSARAQELDSLWRVWNDTTLPDTARMQAMDYITFDHYMFNKPDTAYILAGLVLDLAQRKGNKRYEAWALNAQGASLEERGDLPNALYRFQRSAAIMEESGDVRRLAIMCNNIGSVLSDLDEKAQAKI